MMQATTMRRPGGLLRALADQALKDPTVSVALLAGGLPAAAPVLAGVLERLLRAEADRRGSDSLRVYPRRNPDDGRQLRDQKLRALMIAGISPAQAAEQVGCSRAHAYVVLGALRRASKGAP